MPVQIHFGVQHKKIINPMRERKRARIGPHQHELDQAAIEYHPFAISCWGRLHPAAAQMLRTLAKVKARREGGTGAELIFRQLVSRITALVWRRAARMALRCRPQSGDDEGPDDPVVDPSCAWRAGSPHSVDLPPL